MSGNSLFDPEAALGVTDVASGLELLARSRPLWPIGAEEWSHAVAGARAFAEAWDSQARAAGWTSVELYGLHRRASYARLAAMGAAWLIARSGHRAVGVDAGAITVGTYTGNRLRIYRTEADPDAVLAWMLRSREETRST
ncbi:MAG: hypothetical protein ABSA90_11825 [Xanthobacteraceae bacterium]|jgi:hypothetical protein